MCSIAMPAVYEMLIARSPPVFSHSPPAAADFLANYTNFHVRYEPSRPHQRARQYTFPAAHKSAPEPPSTLPLPAAVVPPSVPSPTMPVAVPRRPCLVVRPEDTSSSILSSDEIDLRSPSRHKKKVVFADDKGLSLTQVRLMTEPSNVPPMWSFQFLEQVTKGISAEVAPEPWEVTFPQPASDYVDFRHRLDTGNVSLENVIVRESEETVVGTVKVRNLSFHKEVFVHSSSDDWATHEDAFCTFVDNNTSTAVAAAYVLYDTFSFHLTLPPRSRRIEFCVCFRCEGVEYWDNNSGKNYVLLKKSIVNNNVGEGGQLDDKDFLIKSNQRRNDMTSPTGPVTKCRDALDAKLTTWSEFASWNHLDNDSPYW